MGLQWVGATQTAWMVHHPRSPTANQDPTSGLLPGTCSSTSVPSFGAVSIGCQSVTA